MRECDGLTATRRLHETMPEARVLIVTMYDEHGYAPLRSDGS